MEFEKIEGVRCETCGKLHDLSSETFISFHGNVTSGAKKGIYGNKDCDKITVFCKNPACINKLLKYVKENPIFNSEIVTRTINEHPDLKLNESWTIGKSEDITEINDVAIEKIVDIIDETVDKSAEKQLIDDLREESNELIKEETHKAFENIIHKINKSEDNDAFDESMFDDDEN